MSRRMSRRHIVAWLRRAHIHAACSAGLASGVVLLGACTEQAEPLAPTALNSRAPAQALVSSDWPSAANPGVPAYARIEVSPPHVYSDGATAVIVFYRDPSCVPAEFNLLTFYDAPAAFGCPLRVAGSSMWQGAVSSDPPKQSTARGTAVPVWLAPAAAIEAAIADGTLTMGELQDVEGLVRGTAARFHEVLQPGGGGHPLWKLVLGATGTLEDGRAFSVHLTSVDGDVKSIRIEVR